MFTRDFAILIILLITPLVLLGQVIFEPPLGRNQPIFFPDTPVGAESVIMLNVTNNGNAACQVRLNAPGEPFIVEPGQIRLNPGDLGAFTMTFAPQEARDFRAQLTGIIAIGMMLQQIGPATLNGTGIEEDEPQPQIEINPENFRILIEEDDGEVVERLTIDNVGNEVLVGEIDIPDVAWLMVDPDEFRIDDGDVLRVALTLGDDWPENGDYETSITINSNDPENRSFEVPILLTVEIPQYVDRELQLRPGWNMISSNVDFAPDFIDDEGPDMRLILNDIVEQVLIIKDATGGFSAPPFNFWGLQQWETPKGYLLKTTEETELAISGLPIPFDRRIELNNGWNMIAYYPNYRLQYLDVFVDLVERDQLIIAKNQFGQFYNPEFGFGWQFFMGPGEGIMVKVREDCILEYPPDPD